MTHVSLPQNQRIRQLHRWLLTTGLLLAMASPGRPDNRIWFLADGSRVVAELQGISRSGEVILAVPDGEPLHIPIADFKPADVEFIRMTGGRTALPTIPVNQQQVRTFLGFPLGALRGEVHLATKGRFLFGPEAAELSREDWAEEQIWLGEIDPSRELWVTRGNDQVAEADLTALVFRKGRLTHVFIRITVAPEESEKTALFQQLRSKLQRLYGLMEAIELGDNVREAWQTEVANVHVGLVRRMHPEDVITISGTYLPLTRGVTLPE